MKYELRSYQKAASDAAVTLFKDKRKKSKKNGLLVLPTGSGKSLIIADIASKIDEPLLILQPSKEILEQNFAKLQTYSPWDCEIYSASLRRKKIARITFATIKSIMNHIDDFNVFHNVLIDECHLCNSNGGQYETFIHYTERKVIGLTATPYRLERNELKFLTRTRPHIFQKVLYYCQISELLAKGYLAKINYYDLTTLDMSRVASNSTGADYDDESLLREYERSDFYNKLAKTTLRVLKPKSGIPRNGILVFTRFIREAEQLLRDLKKENVICEIVTGETSKVNRESILRRFKAGEIQVVANVGTLTTGFDYPELDTVILARPTKSLALYYQMVGRCIRPYKDKQSWLIDLGGTYKRFGAVSDLQIFCPPGTSKWAVYSRGRRLTNVQMY